MIEQCWPYLKRATTAKGAPTSRAAATQAWQEACKELEQPRIQQWIERIPVHIREVIRLEGGNEYKEGRGVGRVRRKDMFGTRHGSHEEERGTGEGGSNNGQNNQDGQGNQSNQGEREERDGHGEGYGEYNSEDEWEEWL